MRNPERVSLRPLLGGLILLLALTVIGATRFNSAEQREILDRTGSQLSAYTSTAAAMVTVWTGVQRDAVAEMARYDMLRLLAAEIAETDLPVALLRELGETPWTEQEHGRHSGLDARDRQALRDISPHATLIYRKFVEFISRHDFAGAALLVFLLIYPKIPNYREEMEEEEEEDEQPAEDVQPLAQELPVQEEVKEEMPVVQQEKRPTLNDMELEADEEEDEPLVFEDDGREIPYLINREPVFRLEKKERKKKRKKKKRRSIFYFIPFVKKRVDKKEAEAKRPAWTPAPREESTKKLENDWILDFYGYERRPKDNTNIQSDEPYIPKVVDVEQENTTETDTHKDEIDQ